MAGNGWHVIGVGVKFHVGPCRLLSEVGGTLGKRVRDIDKKGRLENERGKVRLDVGLQVLAAWLSGLSKALNSLQVSSQQNNVVPSVNLAAVLHGKFS
ncbi:hypothetical protein V1477_010034 [Vespula maculifrons]|uniref:Uncharacterized protein n=1 Tax=Vespula maculifrons TaxID=7453 RepID=A0ABD2CC91_VESMC